MRKVDFIPPDTKSWKKWVEKCTEQSEVHIAAVESGSKPKVKALFKEQKVFYTSKSGPFKGKCAYCESWIKPHDDLDHFRPHAKVTDEKDTPIENHKGYYWLAYSWENFLPACTTCNRPSEKIGKRSRFPVKGFRAFSPGDERKENALLINPTKDDPKSHLHFDELNGALCSDTEKGQVTIRVLSLNRSQLREGRKRAWKWILTEWAGSYLGEQSDPDRQRRLIEDVHSGKLEYASICSKALGLIKKDTEPI